MALFDPGNPDRSQAARELYAAFEIWYTVVDFLAAAALVVLLVGVLRQLGASTAMRLGLPATAWRMDGLEYFGSVGFLKSGLWYADRITTVSPTYAAEIRTAEGGMGLALIKAAFDEVDYASNAGLNRLHLVHRST